VQKGQVVKRDEKKRHAVPLSREKLPIVKESGEEKGKK